MNAPLLSIRLSRRAIGAVALADDAFTFRDGRHLTSQGEKVIPAATRYFHTLIQQSRPGAVAVYAPTTTEGVTHSLVTLLRLITAEHQLPLHVVETSELLDAFGVTPVRTRAELHRVMESIWPESIQISGRVKPYIIDAAAVALVADVSLVFHQPAP